MKGLNLKNAMGKVMKRPNMKAIFDLIGSAKSVVLIMILTISNMNLALADDPRSQSNGKPYKDNGVWYAVFSIDETIDINQNRTPYVFAPTQGNLTFDYQRTTGRKRIEALEYPGSGTNWNSLGTASVSIGDDTWYTFNKPCSRNITQISIKDIEYSGYWHIKNIKIKLAPHILLYDNGSTFGAASESQNCTTTVDQPKSVTFSLRSFLTTTTDGGFTITQKSDGSEFTCSIPTTNPGTNACGVYGGGNTGTINTNADAYKITVTFTPTTAGAKTGQFEISNGTNKVTVTVYGYANTITGQSVNYSSTAHDDWEISTAQTGFPIQLDLAKNKDIWGTMDEMNGQLVLSSGTSAYTVDNANRTITLANSGSTNTEIRTQNLTVQFNGSNRIATNANCTINIPIKVKIYRFPNTHNNDVTAPVAFNIPSNFKHPIEVKTSYKTSCPTCYHYEMSANGTSGWQKAPLTITSGNTYYIRFAPGDSYQGGDKLETVTVTDKDGNTYNFRITGKPLETTTSVSTSLSYNNLTATDEDFTIARNLTNFTIGPSFMNTQTYVNKLTFKSNDESVVKIKNGNTVEVVGYGTTTITATLPRSEDHYTESSCEINVSVARVDRNLTWVTGKKPTSVEVFSTYSLEATTTDTKGTVGTISYAVSPNDAATVDATAHTITFNNCSTATITASLPETQTYNSKSISYSLTPEKVQPTISWTGDGLENTHYTRETINLTGTIRNKQNNWTSDIKLTYRSSNPSVAEVKTNSDGSYYIKTLTAGTAIIYAEVAEGFNNKSASTNFTITVNKSAQTITSWNSSALDGKFTGESVTMSATASSGLTTFEYTSSNNDIATCSNGVVTFHRGGRVTITIKQLGDNEWDVVTAAKTVIVGLDFGSSTNVGQYSAGKEVVLSSFPTSASNFNLYTSSSNYRIIHHKTNNVGVGRIYTSSQKWSKPKTDDIEVKLFPLNTTSTNETLYVSDGTNTYQVPLKGIPQPTSLSFGNVVVPAASGNMNLDLPQHYSVEGRQYVSVQNNNKIFRLYRTSNDSEISNFNESLDLEDTKMYCGVRFYPVSNSVVTTATTVSDVIKVRNVVNESGYSHDVTYEVPVSGTYTNPVRNIPSPTTIGIFEYVTVPTTNKRDNLVVASSNPTEFLINGNPSTSVTTTTTQFQINFFPKTTNQYTSVPVYITETLKESPLTQQVCTVFVNAKANPRTLNGFESNLRVGESGTTQVPMQIMNLPNPGNYQLVASEPSVFFIDGLSSAVPAANTTFNITFNPKQRKTYNETIYLIDAQNNQYPVAYLTATCSNKAQTTVSWRNQGQFDYEEDEYISDLVEFTNNASLTPIYTIVSGSTSVIDYANASHTVLKANSSGTETISVSFSQADYDNYDITLPTTNATITVSNLHAKYIQYNRSLEYLRYDNQGHTSADVPLDAILVDRNGNTISGTINYTLTSNPDNAVSIVTVNGVKYIRVNGTGDATLNIYSPQEGGYSERSEDRAIHVSQYVASCDGQAFALLETKDWKTQVPAEEHKTVDIETVDGVVKPIKQISITLKTTGGNPTCTFNARVNYSEGPVIISKSATTTYPSTTITYNVPNEHRSSITALYLEWINDNGWRTTWFDDAHVQKIEAKQASYFENKSGVSSLDFSGVQITSSSTKNTQVIYSALHDNVEASISGDDAACFSVPATLSITDCSAFGTLNVPVTFTPTSVKDNFSATLTLKGYTDADPTTPTILTIDLTGSSTKRGQNLSWDASQATSGKYTTTPNSIELKAQTNVTPLTGETDFGSVTYTSADESIATVAQATDGKWYITTVNLGSTRIIAHHNGGSYTLPATDIDMTFTVEPGIPDITITPTPESPYVFGSTHVTATSSLSTGAITFDIASTYDGTNKNASISNISTGAGNSSCDVNIITRTNSVEGYEGKVTITATIVAAGKYDTYTETKTIDVQKIKPIISWAGSELNGQFNTNTNITLTGTISNHATNWTDDIFIKYVPNISSIATVNGTTLTTGAAGFTKVRATVEEKVNNFAADEVSHVLEVKLGAFGPTTLGQQSPGKAFIIEGGIISGEQTITAPAEFEVSLSENSGYGASISLDLSTTKTFYVRFAPTTGTSTTAGALTKSGNITISGTTRTIPVSGTFAWPTKEFGSITIGTASASQNIELSNGTYNITVPDGYFVSANDQSNWRQGNLTGVSITKYLYIKFQPNSGTSDYSNKTIIITNSVGTINVGVNGTAAANSISISQSIGLAKDKTFAMSNFTVVNSATASIDASKDYYLSSEGGADPSKWSKSGVQITSGSTLYIKFQPSDNVADRTGDINITADGKTYIIHVAGTALTDAGTISNVSVGTSRWYGFSKSNETVGWYYFKNGRNAEEQFNKLEATFIVEGLSANPVVPATITMTNNANKLFALNDNDADIGYTKSMNSYTDIVRVSFSPRETTTSNVTSTIQISANSKTYTYTVSGSAQEQEYDFGSVDVGKASEYHSFSLSAFRPSWGATDKNFSISAITNYLFSKDATTWSKTLSFDNSAGWGDVFHVKFVPESDGDFGYTSFYITDNGTSNRGTYKFNVKGTGVASSKSFTSTVDAPSTSEKFIMSNFTPAGMVKVNAPANFAVSADNNTFSSSIDLNAGTNTFWIRQEAVNQSGSLSGGVVKIIDQTTSREYPISVSSTVNKLSSSITVPTRIILFSNDLSVKTIVGDGYYVHGNPKEIEPDITLEVTQGGDYLEVYGPNNNQLRIKPGVTITESQHAKVKAKFAGNNRCAGPIEEEFEVKINYVKPLNNNRAWQFVGGKWYIYNIEDLFLGSSTGLTSLTVIGTVQDYTINVYLPNKNTSNERLSLRCYEGASCAYSSSIYCDEASNASVSVNNVTSTQYSDNTSSFSIHLPDKGDDAQLTTLTDIYRTSGTPCSSTGNAKIKLAKIEIPVPQHYHTKTTSTSVDFGNVQIGEVAYRDIPLNNLFKSFLTSNGLKITPATGCPQDVFANSTSHTSEMLLIPGNTVLSPYNKLSANAGLVVDKDNNYYIRLYFNPQSIQTLTDVEAFTLSDEGMSISINVSGNGITGASEPQYITWNQDLSQLTDTGTVQLDAKSASGLQPTGYEIVNGNNVTINGTTLKYNSDGRSVIKVKFPGGEINGITYDTAYMKKTVTVSSGTTPAACTEVLDVSSWNKSHTTIIDQNFEVTASENGPIEATKEYSNPTISFNCSFSNCNNPSLKIYLDGTDNDHLLTTVTTASSQSILLKDKKVNKGSRFYCSFTGTCSGFIGTTISYTITDFTITSNQNWQTVTASTVDFGSQRIGQAGITKNIKAADFYSQSGVYKATITSTSGDADCFAIVSANPISSSCGTGVAAWDVQFIPRKSGTHSAVLHVVNPSGASIYIPLTGTGVKRNVKVKWGYADETLELNAVGTDHSVTLNQSQNAFLYDKLRTETAKLTTMPTYTVVTKSGAELLPTKTGQDIIQITTDADGYITNIEATGYGSGTAYVIATAGSITSSDPMFNEITTEEDKCTLTVVVKKVSPTITTDEFTVGTTLEKKYLESLLVNAHAMVGDEEIEDIDKTKIYVLGGNYGILQMTSSDEDIVEITNNNTLNMKELGTVTITIKIVDSNGNDGDAISNAATGVFSLEVKKATPTLTAVQNEITLTYPQEMNTGQTVTLSTNNTVDVSEISWSIVTGYDADMISPSLNANISTIKPLEKVGTTTITFKCGATTHYEEGTVDVTVHVQWGAMTLTIDTSKLIISSVTHEYDMDNATDFVTSNYPNNVSYTYSINSWSGDQTLAYMDGTNKKLTIKSIGNISFSVTGTHSGGTTANKTSDPQYVRVGTLEFIPESGSDNEWNTGGNWFPHRDRVPNQTDFDAYIANPSCVLDNTNIGACRNLEITSAGSLEIEANGVLDVKKNITNTDASKLVLKANTTNSATVIFHDGTPQATIEIYMKGRAHPELYGEYQNPDWQYRGFVGNYIDGLKPDSVKVYLWNEENAATNTSGWQAASSYYAWSGYCMANMQSKVASYKYTTTLLPFVADDNTGYLKTYDLSYHGYSGTTSDDDYKNSGVNIFTNSFSAPLKVSDLYFEAMDATVWFFNTTYYLDWKSKKANKNYTYYTSCPQKTCNAVSGCTTTIPAGQAFLIQATKTSETTTASKLSITTTSVHNASSGVFYMPEEEEHFNILGIYVASDTIYDKLFLLENENCSEKYDNGYDGRKKFASGLPQIYAYNKSCRTDINADSSMLGQFIGFVGVDEMTEYEISFDIDRLEGFDELYLFDHKTRQYTNILRGNTYHFTATAGDDPERFQIMGRRDDGTYYTGEEQWIEVVGDEALLHGYDNEEAMIYVTDLSGKIIWNDNSKNGPWFRIDGLPAGVYFIRCGQATAKFIRK